jgi:TrmH family RNA methyltransferase
MLSKSKIKYLASLRKKKFREKNGQFIMEGHQSIHSVLQINPKIINHLFATESWIKTYWNEDLFPRIQLEQITLNELKKVSSTQSPNHVIGVLNIEKNHIDKISRLSFLLDSIRDPGNLGTIIRIADWFGFDNVLCTKGTVDCYNPKVVQSSMGSVVNVNIVYGELAELLGKLDSVPIYTLDLTGRPLKTMSVQKPLVIAVGNESHGISDLIKEKTPESISISGGLSSIVDSLNAGIAAGIAAFYFSD